MKPPFRKRRPATVAAILKSVLSGKNMEKRIEDCKIFEVWDDVVGDKIAPRTEPVSLRKGMLKVIVSDHAWLQQLQFLKEEIKERLNAKLGRDVVESFYFQIGSVHEKKEEGPDIAGELKKVKLSKEERAEIEDVFKDVENQEIKESMKKVLVKEAKRKKLEAGRG